MTANLSQYIIFTSMDSNDNGMAVYGQSLKICIKQN